MERLAELLEATIKVRERPWERGGAFTGTSHPVNVVNRSRSLRRTTRPSPVKS